MVKRAAFTMIELIFAIVVMGIVMISIPMLLISNNEAVETNILQEAVFIAAAKTNQVLSFAWDENSIDPSTTLAKTQVVENAGVTRVAGTDFAPGHILQPLHRRMTPNSAIRAATGITTSTTDGDTVPDDIDDFNNVSVTIDKNTTVDSYNVVTGYKNQYIVSAEVEHNVPGRKEVTIKVIDNPNTSGTYVQLPSSSFNIGEVDYYKRTFLP